MIGKQGNLIPALICYIDVDQGVINEVFGEDDPETAALREALSGEGRLSVALRDDETDLHIKLPDDVIEDEQPDPKKTTISNLINIKVKATQLASIAHFKKEDGGVTDKAKLITVLRMYKIQKEKSKMLYDALTNSTLR